MAMLNDDFNRFCNDLNLYSSFGWDDAKLKHKLCSLHSIDMENIDGWIARGNAAITENEARRQFVVSFMHYSGDNHSKLDSKQLWKVYCQADGFGFQRASELKKINEGWDYSHVRDSTINGFKRMEKALSRFGFTM